MHVFFSCWVVLHPKQQLHMKVLVEVPTKNGQIPSVDY